METAVGVKVEKQEHILRIQNFSFMARHDEFIYDQKLEFLVGGSLGLSSKWRIFLAPDATYSPDYVGIYVQLLEEPKHKQAYLIAGCDFEIKHRDGTCFLDLKLGTLDWYKPENRLGRGFAQFVRKDTVAPLLDNGDLVVHCKFQLCATQASVDKQSVEEMLHAFQVGSAVKAWADVVHLAGFPVDCSGVQIICKDGGQFQMRKEILTARSPVFEAMLRSDMTEKANERIELKDVSSQTMKVILRYMYIGQLLPEWREPDVIHELTNAAAKYQLQELLDFLDKALGKVCEVGNVAELLSLADKLDLKTAVGDLMEFAKREGFGSKEKLFKVLRID